LAAIESANTDWIGIFMNTMMKRYELLDALRYLEKQRSAIIILQSDESVYLQWFGWVAGKQSTIVSQVVPSSVFEIVIAVTLD